MHRRELVAMLMAAKSSRTADGVVVGLLVDCPQCGAPSGERCRSFTWPKQPPSHQLHAARRRAAVEAVEKGLT